MKACLVAALLVGSIAAGTAMGEQNDRQAHEDYLLHCMGCHGEQGRGLTGKVPSFPDDLGRLLTSPGGREFIQRVPGVTQSELPSARLAAVLNWIVRNFAPPEVGERIAPFSAAEVDRLRTRPLMEVARQRPEL